MTKIQKIIGCFIIGGIILFLIVGVKERQSLFFGADRLKITGLDETTTPSTDALFLIADTPSTAPTSKSVALTTIASSVSSIGLSSGTQIGSKDVCLEDGTNCASEADTLSSVTGRGAVTPTATTFNGGLTTANLTATGTTDIQGDMTFVDSTGTSVYVSTLRAPTVCLTGDSCKTSWPTDTDDQTWQETLAQGNTATSSFITYGNATATNMHATGTFMVDGNTILANTTSTSLFSTSGGFSTVYTTGLSSLGTLTVTHGTSTSFHSDYLCLTGDNCISTWPTGGTGVIPTFSQVLEAGRAATTTPDFQQGISATTGTFSGDVTLAHGTGTSLTGDVFCLTGDDCITSWPVGENGVIPQFSQVLEAGRSATTTPSFDMGFTATTGTITNATTTNLDVSTRLGFSNATGTSLFSGTVGSTSVYSTNGTITNMIQTNGTSTSFEISNTGIIANLIALSVTWTDATGTSLEITGLTQLGELTVTNGTSTSWEVAGLLLVGGQTVCLTDGTGCPAASDSLAGVIEIATTGEVNTGTATNLAIVPNTLAESYAGTKAVEWYLTTSTGAFLAVNGASNTSTCITIPPSISGMNLVTASATHGEPGSGSWAVIQVRNQTQSADMLSTPIYIDGGELNSWTAVTSTVIDTSNDDVAAGDRVCADVDQVATTPGKETQIILQFRLP